MPSLERSSSHLTYFKLSNSVIGRFVFKRALKSTLIIATIFGVFVTVKATGLVNAYPTAVARLKFMATFSNNVGIELLLGRAPHTPSTGPYVAWNTLAPMAVIGAIWALMLATKYFRGEEESGRWETMLSGQTTSRGAAVNNLIGLAANLTLFYVIISIIFSLMGRYKGLDISISSALFFALATISSVAIFLLVGVLSSQLMPTRSRAVGLAAAALGISFIVRVIGDITASHWVLDFTPLGWVEKLNPLSDSTHPLWFIPIGLSIIGLGTISLYLARKRDLGQSIIADKDSSSPRFGLLNSPFGLSVRLARYVNFSWLVSLTLLAFLFGTITKTAAQSFAQSQSALHVLRDLTHQDQVTGSLIFLGIVFLLLMIFVMVYAASAISAIRRDEADGYLDNILVRPVSRLSWIFSRLGLVIYGVIIAGGLIFVALWGSLSAEHSNISLHVLFDASLNALVPAGIVIGIGIFTFGLLPRLTSVISYGIIGWSFLITLVSSGLHINHWILDSSIVNQVVLAPAASPKWSTDIMILLIALILGLIGILAFNRRDLLSD